MNFLMRRLDMVKKFPGSSDSHADMRLRSRAIPHTELRSPGKTAASFDPDVKLPEKTQELKGVRSSRSNHVKLGSKDAAVGSPRTGRSSKDDNVAEELRSTPKSASSKVNEVDEHSPSCVTKPQKSTTASKEMLKSAKNSVVDAGTPKSTKSRVIADEVKPRTTRATRNLDGHSSSTPKSNAGASESTAKSKSSTDEGLRTPRKVRSKQTSVSKELHSSPDDDFIDLKTSRASSKTKELVSKSNTPQKNGKAVIAKLAGSNREASFEENATKVKPLVSKPKNGTALEISSPSSFKRKNGIALETSLSSGKKIKKKENDEEIANEIDQQSDESDCDKETSSSKFHLWPPRNA